MIVTLNILVDLGSLYIMSQMSNYRTSDFSILFCYATRSSYVTSVSTADDIIVISQSIISFDAHCDLCSAKAS